LDTRTLANGSHTLVLRELGNNGLQTDLTRNIIVDNYPPLGTIEGPSSDGQIVSGQQYQVRGWFLDGSGVSKIEVLVDGNVMGQAIYGFSREDVYSVYPAYNNHNAGYSYLLNTTGITSGTHTLSVRETGLNGGVTTYQRSINVIPVQGNIDVPNTDGQLVSGAQYQVGGWVLDGGGVTKVEILVDGTLMGQATYGILREDVYNAYPSYNNHNSGFGYNLNTTNIANGSHTLSIRETGSNGGVTIFQRPIVVSN